jgi:hypothetical protein
VLIEIAPHALPGLLNTALDATLDDGLVFKCYDALNFGPPNNLQVLAASVGIAMDDIFSAVDALTQLADTWIQPARPAHLFTSPIGIRWVKSSDAFMAPQFGRDTCMVEVPLLHLTANPESTLTAYVDMMFQRFAGRPHWGQYNPMDRARLEASYPRLPDFAAAYRTLNPGGLWDNGFTQQIGLRDIAGQT